MKTKLLLILALLISITTQAQTEFTYTGTGLWTDQANWSPSYPGLIPNPNDTITIEGNCTVQNTTTFINSSQLNISGRLDFESSEDIEVNSIFLDDGVLTAQFSLRIGFFSSNVLISGSGEVDAGFRISLSRVTINPGDTSSGSILFGQSLMEVTNSEFIFDIYSISDFDTVVGTQSGNNSFNNLVTVNVANPNSINHNDTFVLFDNTDENLFNSLTLNTGLINGFQPQLNFVSNGIGNNGDIELTLMDIESPTITNCPNPDVTADCGTFYTIPDYTTTTLATDNDSSTTITFTQSLPAGLGATDGTEITITATDSTGNSSDCTFTLNVAEDTTLANDDLDDIVSRNISLFPNPSQGEFTLKNTSGLNLENAELIDVKGALIQTIDLSAFTDVQTIDLSALNPAIYFFKIYTADGVATKKIIIE